MVSSTLQNNHHGGMISKAGGAGIQGSGVCGRVCGRHLPLHWLWNGPQMMAMPSCLTFLPPFIHWTCAVMFSTTSPMSMFLLGGHRPRWCQHAAAVDTRRPLGTQVRSRSDAFLNSQHRV